ncbi:hypothetical protein BUALT_Bualt01G0135900 [Buddleja alternifolia]|uniref:ACB domain-containing protein n=1 Tax=Buddleja alternifolia TaxID=168488 RepID=A0AAV6Y6Z1_9LAMI|nr:hypothetical protein BUALT_Bualt01G0135900 [Buddleja alternifolia]
MDYFQEPTFTAFLALILCFVVAKVVTFAVSNSTTDGNNTAVCSVNEGEAAKGETLNRGLRVGKTKGKKSVKFVDEVVIKRVDHYEGSENLVLLEDVEEKSVIEIAKERVHQFGDDGLNEDVGEKFAKEQCFDVREMHDFDVQDKGGCEKIEQICDGGKMDGGFGENEKILEISGMKTVILEERNDVVLESEDMIIDQNEGNGLVGSGENEGLTTKSSSIDPELNTKGSSSCHISSGIDHDSFASSLEDEGLITKNSSIDSILNDKGPGSCHINSGVYHVPMWHNQNPFMGSGGNEGIIEGDVEDYDGKVKDESVEYEDDEWEGIERSELEKFFAEAVNYMEYGGKGDDRLAKLGSDVQMQLYGLHKVAVEGPCHEPQPMALKVSARAKWNAWQKLGSTSQEAAMEQYIRILEDSIPGWMNNHSTGPPKLEPVGKASVPGYDRKLELNAAAIGDSSTDPSFVEKGDLV